MSARRKPKRASDPPPPPPPPTPEQALRLAWEGTYGDEARCVRAFEIATNDLTTLASETLRRAKRGSEAVFNSYGLLQGTPQLDHLGGRLTQMREQKKLLREIAEAMGVTLEAKEVG